jgi:hypothetical protein
MVSFLIFMIEVNLMTNQLLIFYKDLLNQYVLVMDQFFHIF